MKVIEIKLEVLEWYHFCLMKNLSTYLFFVDGHLIDEYGFDFTETIPLNGSIVLGQDVSSMIDISMAPHFLAGQIANFELWFITFTQEALILRGVKPLPLADISSDGKHWDILGNIALNRLRICNERGTSIILNSIRLGFDEIFTWCQNLGMHHSYPRDKEEFQNNYVPLIRNLPENCQKKYNKHNQISVSLVYNYSSDSIYDLYSKNTVDFINKEKMYSPNSKTVGAKKLTVSSKGHWASRDFSTPICFVCDGFLKIPTFSMRGLCENNKVINFKAKKYKNSWLYFQGYYGEILFYDHPDWVLFHLPTRTRIASLMSEKLPFGKREWSVYIEYGVCNALFIDRELQTSSRKPRKLVFSSCSDDDEFTCGDGSCIPLRKRCSLNKDCEDGSDENDCTILYVYKKFSKFIPPPLNPFQIAADLVITKVGVCFSSIVILSGIILKD